MTEVIEETVRCPLCNNTIVDARLALIGLSEEQLNLLREHVENSTLKEILSIAEIALRRIDPERTSVEFQLNEAVSKLRQTFEDMAKKSMDGAQEFLEKYSQAKETEKAELVQKYQEDKLAEMKNFQRDISDRTKTIETLEKQNLSQFSEIRQNISEIKEKIVGTGIGRVGELVTIRDLKEVVPSDSFSELRASKGGTDIVGTVKENGSVYGTITISNKCTQKWSGDFTTQIVRNMRDDGSQFGILVSKVFPGEALSSKA